MVERRRQVKVILKLMTEMEVVEDDATLPICKISVSWGMMCRVF
jgi:hypothetical protein